MLGRILDLARSILIGQPMKICIVTTAFPRWAGDNRAPFVFECARAIHEAGHEVRIIAMHNPGAKTHETIDGMEIFRPHYLPERFEILQKESGGLPIAWKKNPLAILGILPFIVVHALAIIRYARDCDIIHANWTLSGFVSWISAPWHKKPYLVTVQGSDIFQASQIPFIKQASVLSLRRAKRILALSQSLARGVISLGIDPRQIDVIPNGVDIRQFHPSDNPRQPIILFVGSLIERKGVRYLIQAFAKITNKFPKMQLVIVGEGFQKGELIELAIKNDVYEKTNFIGAQSPQQVLNWMQQAQVFVLPSLEEGLGVVLLEALACGTPCIGSRVGGIPDVITSQTGFLVAPENSDALATALTCLLIDHVMWEEMSLNARHRAVHQFCWSVIAKRIIHSYSLIIGKAQRINEES